MRRKVTNRNIPNADIMYGSVKIEKLINYVMERGKKDTARKIVYKVMEELKKEGDPVRLEILWDTEGRPKTLPALLRLGALLHDVAKPACAKMLDGRLRFFEHEAEGARMAGKIMDRLRCSRDEAGWVSAWIVYHLRPGNLASNRIVSDKAVFRFFRDLGPKGVGLLLLCWADHASYLTPARLASVLRWTRRTRRPSIPARSATRIRARRSTTCRSSPCSWTAGSTAPRPPAPCASWTGSRS